MGLVGAIAAMRSNTPDDSVLELASSGIMVHQSRTLTRADIRTNHGIRVTSLARTLLDCAPSLTRLTRTVNDALRRPHMSRAQLADVVMRNPTQREPSCYDPSWPLRPARPAPSSRTVPPVLPAIRAPATAGQHDRSAGYEVDALFPAERVIVELDGWDFHNDRAAFERDRNRDADLLAAGFVTVRITWQRLVERPAAEAARLHRILAMRRDLTPWLHGDAGRSCSSPSSSMSTCSLKKHSRP